MSYAYWELHQQLSHEQMSKDPNFGSLVVSGNIALWLNLLLVL